MFWRKKSNPQKDNYISFYLDGEDLQVEFGFDDINQITLIADLVLNGKIRNSCFQTIKSKLEEEGLKNEAAFFAQSVDKTIKPSEYAP